MKQTSRKKQRYRHTSFKALQIPAIASLLHYNLDSTKPYLAFVTIFNMHTHKKSTGKNINDTLSLDIYYKMVKEYWDFNSIHPAEVQPWVI